VRVALTFDAEHPDRPGCPPGVAEHVLDRLAEAGVRGTFLLQGRWAEAYPDTARRIVEEGHLVGSHSHYHVPMPLLTDAGLAADLVDAGRAIREAAGVDPRPWFRCPWGLGADDARVLGALERAGYRHVGWDVVAEDWGPDRTAADVEEAVVGAALSRDRDAVVLLHTWPASVPQALDGIVRRLREVGAELITVAEVPAAHLDATPNPGHVAGR
jgi:peptidoglycan/xylan/chitin deacetylase (PgdA/CDA1 family)